MRKLLSDSKFHSHRGPSSRPAGHLEGAVRSSFSGARPRGRSSPSPAPPPPERNPAMELDMRGLIAAILVGATGFLIVANTGV